LADNLTSQFKQKLKEKGIVASEADIKNFLKDKNLQPPGSEIRQAAPMRSFDDAFGKLEEEGQGGLSKNAAFQFVGSTLWGAFDAALLGVPSLAVGGADDELFDTGAGRVGDIFGQAVGFLAPMGVAGTIGKAGIAATKGTVKLTHKAAEAAAKTAGTAGLSKEVAEKAVKDVLFEDRFVPGLLSKSVMKTKYVPQFAHSGEHIAKVEAQVRHSIAEGLKKRFPNAVEGQVDEMAEAAMHAFTKEGVHINSIGKWLEKSMNTYFSVEDKSHITRYVAHALDMGVSFSIYGLMRNAIHSYAGEEEFAPAQTVWDSMKFASLLPLVEAIPGGGKVKIMREALGLKKTLNKMKNTDVNKLDQRTANDLLRVLSKDNWLRDASAKTTLGKDAAAFVAGGKDLPVAQAREALKELYGKIDINTLWKDFAKYARDDLGESLLRMGVVGLYFNAHTLMDRDLINSMPGDELFAHMMVGAMFGKVHKPLYRDKTPHLTEFQERRHALELMGIDASGIQHMARAYDNQMHISAAFSGLLANKESNDVNRIINRHKDQMSSLENRVGESGITEKDNLVKWAFDIYKHHELSARAHDPKDWSPVEITHLSRDQISKIDADLRKLEVEIKPGEKELLNESNFHEWKDKIFTESLENVGKTYIDLVLRGAREMNLETDFNPKTDTISLDKPIGVPSLKDLENYIGVKGYENIIYWQRVRDALELYGYIKPIEVTAKDQPLAKDITPEINKKLGQDMEITITGEQSALKVANYGQEAASSISIHPIRNGFMQALGNLKYQKQQGRLYKIVEGSRYLESEDLLLRDMIGETLGREVVPKSLESELEGIKIVRDKDMTGRKGDERWQSIQSSGELRDVQQELRHIIKIWGVNKSDGPLNNGKGIEYSSAKQLIESLRSRNILLDRESAEGQNRYYWSRLLETSLLNSDHIAMLDHFKAWDVLKVTSRDGRNVGRMPDMQTAERIIRDLQEPLSLSQKEIDLAVQNYETILTELNKAKGKFFEVESNVTMDINAENFYHSISDAYTATVSFGDMVEKRFSDMSHKLDSHSTFYEQAGKLIDKLKDGKGNEKVIKQLEQSDLEATLELIDAVMAYGKQNEMIPQKDVQLLQDLRNAIVHKDMTVKEVNQYESAARVIERMVSENVESNSEIKKLVNNIVYDMANYSHDRIMGKARLDRYVKELTQELKELGLETKEIPEELGDLISKSVELGRAESVIEGLSLRLRAWRMGYEEADFMQRVRENSQHYSDMTTSTIDQHPKFTTNTIKQRYSKYNESIDGIEYNNMLEGIREARELVFQKPSEKNKKALDFRKQKLVDEIIYAIAAKNEVDFSNQKDPEKWTGEAAKEWREFKDYMYPALLSNTIGTTSINTAKLAFNNKGEPILEIGKMPTGKGVTSEFIEEAANRTKKHEKTETSWDDLVANQDGIQIVKFESEGIYNNRKVNVDTIENIENIIVRSKPQPGSKNLAESIGKEEGFIESSRSNAIEPFKDPVPVIVSQNTTLLVGTSNLTDGKLNDWFREYYDNKLVSLDKRIEKSTDKQEKQKLGKIKKHFTDLYSEYADSEYNVRTGKTQGQKNVSAPAVRAMIRAMYWDKISTQSFEDMIYMADNSAKLQDVSATQFKYFSLAEASGAKTRGSKEFVEEMLRTDYLREPERKSYQKILDNGGKLKIVALADELLLGETKETSTKDRESAFLSDYLAENQLNELLSQHTEGSKSYEIVKKQIDDLRDILKSLSGTSSINAHSLLSEDAARVLYGHRGRMLGDTSGRANIAGVKPTGWFNSAEGSILLKTNFTYDPAIARILSDLNIDILTSQSAAKAFNKPLVEIKKSDVPNAKSFQDIIEQSGKFDKAETLKNNIGEIGLENLFIGKTEDRHSLTNVTYAQSDFLSKAGYNSFMENYVNYPKKIRKALGILGNLVTGQDRLASADFLMKVLREEGAIIDDSSMGLNERYLKAGTDPDSILLKRDLERVAHKWIVNSLRKPTSEGSSYSILIPYLEGTPSVYGTIKGEKRQIIFGGKKLADADGRTKISNWNNVKYIANVKVNGENRDIQLARDEHNKWVVDDPFGEITNAKVIVKEIERVERELKNNLTEDNNYMNLHRRLQNTNEQRKFKIYLSSLSLRMPNLGGDVAMHRIEGFHKEIMGNVVGVNLVDLAVIHQGDFDVDALFSHHDAPQKMNSAVFKMAGMAPDAYVYKSEAPKIDVFENGNRADRRAGSDDIQDGLRQHMQAYQKAKDNFGILKRVSSSVSAMDRMGMSVTDLNGDILSQVKMSDRNQFGFFIQRYKNILQTIIDSTKKPNFLSNANPNEVKRWLLFGESNELRIPEDIRENPEVYGEYDPVTKKGYKPLFDMSNITDPVQRKVTEDVIMVALDKLGRNQRFLSDVYDAAGRRAPDQVEIAQMRSDMHRFASNPNKEIFFLLHNRYRRGKTSDEAARIMLEKMFYLGKDSKYKDFKQLRDDFKRGIVIDPVIPVLNLKIKEPEAAPGMYIVNKLKTNHSQLAGYSENLNAGAPDIALEKITRVLDDVEILAAVTGSKGHESLTEMLKNSDIENGMINRLKGDMYSIFKKPDGEWVGPKNKINRDPETVKNYSIMYHILEKQRNSLYRYIRSARTFEGDSIARAEQRLEAVNASLEFIRNRQDSLVDYVVQTSRTDKGKKDNLVNHFYFSDINNKGKGARWKQTNKNTTNNTLYIYKEVTVNGVKRFKKAGYILPGRRRWLAPGSNYVILKNPLKYDVLTNREVLDGYSMLEITGDLLPEDIAGLPRDDISQRSFINKVENLKGDLGTLAKEVYDVSHKNPNATDNWRIEQKQEDAIVDKFMSDLVPRDSYGNERNQMVKDLIRYVIKPEVQFGTVVRNNNINMPLPMFKVNRRLTRAMSRWLLRNEVDTDIFNEIFGRYGQIYRRRKDNVIPEEVSDMLTSQLHHRGRVHSERSALMDLLLPMGRQSIYHAPMLHMVRSELSRYSDRSKRVRDANGELQVVMQYGNMNDVSQFLKVYEDPRNFKQEKSIWDCL